MVRSEALKGLFQGAEPKARRLSKFAAHPRRHLPNRWKT